MHAHEPAEHEHTNRLANRLRERIRREGLMPFREWMNVALYDSADGYYCRSDLTRWGKAGDYLTSPERSPLFAATFACYFVRLYEELGAPPTWTIIEAGAGAGHFASGVLETLQRDYPKVFASTRYIIDEASADAIARAQTMLAPFKERVEFRRLNEINPTTMPVNDTVIFANELLDAFPVHRVKMRDGQLRELCVDCDANGNFIWAECPPTTARLAEYFECLQIELAEGQIAEVNLQALDWMTCAATVSPRAFLIVVDYGAEAAELYESSARPAGTLRAFHRHQFAGDPLARPGEQDLTTNVDWSSIKHAGAQAGLQTILFARQDKFLLHAGLLEQLERLSANSQGEADAARLRASARHMILPDGMSASFQVLIQKSSGMD
jgi:SAM-dependent MidA family methyltransferase